MIRVKSGVTPRAVVIVAAVANVAEAWKRTVVITSGMDGRHMKGSLHYSGNAIDVRSKDFTDASDKRRFLADVLARLGEEYQGILESEGEANEHFHVEYDPGDH